MPRPENFKRPKGNSKSININNKNSFNTNNKQEQSLDSANNRAARRAQKKKK